jgi:hypothetical protein
LDDYSFETLDSTLNLITGLHQKWVVLLKGLSKTDWERSFFHPESKETITLFQNISIYAWHGNHHLAHIKIALDKK